MKEKLKSEMMFEMFKKFNTFYVKDETLYQQVGWLYRDDGLDYDDNFIERRTRFIQGKEYKYSILKFYFQLDGSVTCVEYSIGEVWDNKSEIYL